jgi:CheY-like chemotaxis protein
VKSTQNFTLLRASTTGVQPKAILPLAVYSKQVGSGLVQIALVEDSTADAILVHEVLSEAHICHHLTHYRDGRTAILGLTGPASERDHPDLILLDINLPFHSGFEVLAAIQSTPHLRQVPIAVITSSGLESDRRQAFAGGAEWFLKKPLSLDDFFNDVTHLVAEMLQRMNARRRAAGLPELGDPAVG